MAHLSKEEMSERARQQTTSYFLKISSRERDKQKDTVQWAENSHTWTRNAQHHFAQIIRGINPKALARFVLQS